MQKTILIALALTSAATPVLANNSPTQREAYQAMRCDITDERAVEWTAMDQTVILRTHLIKAEDNDYPYAKLSLILENGTEIDLGGGAKYIDDAEIEVLTDCKQHFDVAIAQTVTSLSRKHSPEFKDNIYIHLPEQTFPTLESLWAYSAMGQDCMDANNLPEEGPSDECIQAAQFNERFSEGLAKSGLSHEDYVYLRDNNAPIITITRSTYYSETTVYDSRDNTVHVLFYEGC